MTVTFLLLTCEDEHCKGLRDLRAWKAGRAMTLTSLSILENIDVGLYVGTATEEAHRALVSSFSSFGWSEPYEQTVLLAEGPEYWTALKADGKALHGVDAQTLVRAQKRFDRQKIAIAALIKRLDMIDPHPPFKRASGDMDCNCGFPYREHPELGSGMVVLCDGQVRKL